MNYRTPLGKAKGLGSAQTGTGHWWMQRVTAFLLIPLSYWLIMLLYLSMYATHQQTLDWIAAPLNSVCLIAWLLAVLYHAALGVQVVIEDYVSTEWLKISSVWLVNLLFLFLGLTALVYVFRIIS